MVGLRICRIRRSGESRGRPREPPRPEQEIDRSTVPLFPASCRLGRAGEGPRLARESRGRALGRALLPEGRSRAGSPPLGTALPGGLQADALSGLAVRAAPESGYL